MDIVITTALIPGKPSPKIITKKMIDGMKIGSVIMDLASNLGVIVNSQSMGNNCL